MRAAQAITWIRSRRAQIAVVCLLIVIFAFDALVQLDELLRGMHVAGQPSVGVSDLASTDPQNVHAVWKAQGYATSASGQADYADVFFIYVLIDSALAVALGVLLVSLATLVRTKAIAGNAAFWGAIAYVAFDLLENSASAVLVLGGHSVGPLILVFTVAKWIFLTICASLIAGQALQVWRAKPDKRRQEIRELVHLLRVLLVVAPLFGLALIAHPQIPDLIRRWTPFQLVVTFGLTLFLALTLWVIACQLTLQRRPWRFLREPPLVVAALVGLAAAQLLVTRVFRLFDSRYDAGWGLAIPAGIVVVGATLGWVLGGGHHQGRRRTVGTWTAGLPAFLAALVLVGLGLGALRASFGEGVFTGQLWDTGDLVTGRNEQLHPLVLAVFAILMPFAAWFVFRTLQRASPVVPAPPADAERANQPARPGEDAAAFDTEPAVPLQKRVTLVGRRWRLAIGAAALLEIVFTAAVWGDVGGFVELVGGVAMLAVFIAGVAMVTGLLVWLSDSIAYPDALPGRTAPIILLLVAWFVVAAKLDSRGPHDARVLPAAKVAKGAPLTQAWDCWLTKNGLGPDKHTCPFPEADFTYRRESAWRGVPLVVVATSGGATRAAYWTATVLDCVFEVRGKDASCADGDERVAAGNFRKSNAIFALSGISGGSAGVATFAAHLAERADAGVKGNWIDERLDRDFLSPTIGWSLFVELPQSMLRYRNPVDSAEVLEQSWEDAWAEESGRGDWRLFDLWRRHHVVPLLLLNGTSVEDGCRFNGSVLDASVETVLQKGKGKRERRFHDCRATGPFDEIERPGTIERVDPKSVLGGTRDLTDFLCGRKYDVRLSTAAILSARFPYVSSSGRIERRCADEDQRNKVTFVVDGGYLETSGASPLVEIQSQLEPMIQRYNARTGKRACVVPFMIQIDNGYEDDAAARAASRPTEILVPPLTILSVRGARAAGAKAQAALLFDRPFGQVRLEQELLNDRYAHFVIQSHAGAKAPLGWALSKTARDALRAQLTQPKNAAALKEVRNWLRPGALRCK